MPVIDIDLRTSFSCHALSLQKAWKSFQTADNIAYKLGIEKDSKFRIKAGILYCLNEFSEKQGSTLVRKDKLAEMCLGLLELPNEYEGEILAEVVNMEIEGLIKSTTLEEEPAVAITKLYGMEKYIANKIKKAK